VSLRDILLQALLERYRDRGVQLFDSAERGPLARFPAAHPEVGDLELGVDARGMGVNVRIGDVLHDDFYSLDTHLNDAERNRRVVQEVVRFLDELFADRLLFWKLADGGGFGWRERGITGSFDPLVLDNLRYLVYLWSRPLGEWQAVPVILGRGGIQSDREYEILLIQLVVGRADPLDDDTRARVTQLVKEYEARRE
jgi:hypothetical protein